MQGVIWILSETAIFVRKSKMLYTFDGNGGVIFIIVFVAFLVTWHLLPIADKFYLYRRVLVIIILIYPDRFDLDGVNNKAV